MITEKFIAVNQKVFCAFVDLEKAFDRVVRAKLWKILPRYNVSGTLAADRKVSLQRSLSLRASRSWRVALV